VTATPYAPVIADGVIQLVRRLLGSAEPLGFPGACVFFPWKNDKTK